MPHDPDRNPIAVLELEEPVDHDEPPAEPAADAEEVIELAWDPRTRPATGRDVDSRALPQDPRAPGKSGVGGSPSASSHAHAASMAEPIEPTGSSLVPRDLLDIFFRPSRFFGTRLAAGSTPYILLVTWCFGIADAMDRIDRQLLQTAMGGNPASWESIGPLVTQSWIGYWAFCLAIGAVSAAFLWMVGGWWFRVRAKWAGDPDPDKRMARLVYVYSSFVMAAPVILVALGQTMVYPDYAAAWQADEVYTLGLLIFPFWAIAASYIGVRSVFNVSAWKARIWFLILPACVYLAAFGIIATAAAFLMA